MNPRDVIRLRHIVDAIEEIQFFIQGKTIDDLLKNRQLTLSIIKLIEIIGEAASRVTQETQDEYSHIPWAEIVGMRNRLVHVYFDVDIDRVWDTTQVDIPELGSQLKAILLKI